MRPHRGLAVCLACAFLFVPCLRGQTVVNIGGTTKELRRTAHQLHITADRLRNARTALKDATDLARRSSDSMSFTQLGQFWLRCDRTNAQAAIDDLYGWLRTAAQGTEDPQSYQRATSSAQALLSALAAQDPELAAELWDRWPDPPSAIGEAARQRLDQMKAMFAKQLAARGARAAPGPDPTRLAEMAASGDYSAIGTMASQLLQTGDKSEALRLADKAIADFQQSQPDSRAISSYVGFVRLLSSIDSERFLTGLNSLLPALAKQANPNAGGTLTVGEQSVQVSSAEAAVLEMCRSLYGRPELAMKTLNSLPGLKAKLDRLGGIDSIMPGSRTGQPPVAIEYSIDGASRTRYTSAGNSSSSSSGPAGAASPPAVSVVPQLFESVRGKLAKNPALVRQKLSEAAPTPDQAEILISLASRAASQEPELAELALEMASRLVMQAEPPQKRASLYNRLIQTYRMCDGEVDTGLLQQGLVLVRQLREAEGDRPAPPPGAAVSAAAVFRGPADQLEIAIVAQLAMDNFDGAMQYLRLLPEEMRLRALLEIVQSLLSPY